MVVADIGRYYENDWFLSDNPYIRYIPLSDGITKSTAMNDIIDAAKTKYVFLVNENVQIYDIGKVNNHKFNII